MRALVHSDFDGVVSALFLGLRDAELRDYPEVPREPLPDTIIVEVYHAENIADSTVVVDHHAPKLRIAPGLDLEAYLLRGGRLAWRAGAETPSMVRGVRQMVEAGVVPPGASPRAPPRSVVAVADALDNAVEPPGWALEALGVREEPRRVLLGYFAAPYEERRRMLRELYERGMGDPVSAVAEFLRDAAAYADSPPPEPHRARVGAWVVLVGRPEEVAYWGLAAQLKGETHVAMVSQASGVYTVRLYSVDDSALRIAKAMGGGGRRTWGRRGYIAGFQAERLRDVLAALRARRLYISHSAARVDDGLVSRSA